MVKFLSRKFLATNGALAAILTADNLSTLQTAVVGVITAVYVLAQAIVDMRANATKAQVTE